MRVSRLAVGRVLAMDKRHPNTELVGGSGRIDCLPAKHMLLRSASYLAVQRHGHTRRRTNAEKSKRDHRSVQRQRRDQTGSLSPTHAGTRLAHPLCGRLCTTHFHDATPGSPVDLCIQRSPFMLTSFLVLRFSCRNAPAWHHCTSPKHTGVVQLPTGKG